MGESEPDQPSNPASDRNAPFWAQLRPKLAAAATLSEAAQLFAEHLYADVDVSPALVRIFVTVPLAWLPAAEQRFAASMLAGTGDAQVLGDLTPVLTLLGTRGIETAWNERAHSVGHRAIPLVSQRFVEEAPMIARLLRETGFSLHEAVKPNRQYVRKIADDGNLFFVGDATTASDERGRRIISAVDFVDRYGIRTVFGSGASFPKQALFLSGIVFTRRLMLREDVESFVALMRELARLTGALATRRTLIAE